jgi:hypothetical protein
MARRDREPTRGAGVDPIDEQTRPSGLFRRPTVPPPVRPVRVAMLLRDGLDIPPVRGASTTSLEEIYQPWALHNAIVLDARAEPAALLRRLQILARRPAWSMATPRQLEPPVFVVGMLHGAPDTLAFHADARREPAHAER